VKVFGVDLTRGVASGTDGPAPHTLVLLDDGGKVVRHQQLQTLPAVAAAVGSLAADEPFVLGVNIPVVVPAKPARARPVENTVRRRFGCRLPPGGRASLGAEPLGVAGEALMAGLATLGLPCLPYPDRDQRRSGLAEAHAGVTIKALLWESSLMAAARDAEGREALFRSYAVPPYRAANMPARSGWGDHAMALELLLRALDPVEGYDLLPARDALARSMTRDAVEQAAALLDAALIAGTALRYLQSPERCLFLGDHESGYVIMPADSLVRRLGASEIRPSAGGLFPQESLRERLGADAALRSVDLLDVPGRPQRIEAAFHNSPVYEFDNVDEMMWWKHCRHLSGPRLPTEGLSEMSVTLDPEPAGAETPPALQLVRSRHRVLSFRFDPPGGWRARVPTRDGRTYRFRVGRAIFQTLPADR